MDGPPVSALHLAYFKSNLSKYSASPSGMPSICINHGLASLSHRLARLCTTSYCQISPFKLYSLYNSLSCSREVSCNPKLQNSLYVLNWIEV
jgi:hypothetical protein